MIYLIFTIKKFKDCYVCLSYCVFDLFKYMYRIFYFFKNSDDL